MSNKNQFSRTQISFLEKKKEDFSRQKINFQEQKSLLLKKNSLLSSKANIDDQTYSLLSKFFSDEN